MREHDSGLNPDGRDSAADRDRCPPPLPLKEVGISSIRRKTDFLGMSYGTACSRLRKLMLLELLRRLKEDKCFRCGKKIENVADLSLEHKEPWLYVSKELFWDLDNISFSHFICNVRHRRHKSTILSKKAPLGTAWCTSCRGFVSTKKFGKNKRGDRNRILRSECNDCRQKKGWDHTKRKGRA